MTKVKICGLRTLADALAAIEAGADLLGFNFYERSPRYVDPETCAQITLALQRESPQTLLVGVFVNASEAEIRSRMHACHLHLAQLHGDEPPQLLKNLGGVAYKAVRLKADGMDLDAAESYAVEVSPVEVLPVERPALLVDAFVPGLYGGSGQAADWQAAAALARRAPILLAGGLTAENAAQAVRQVAPWGVDAASGVESSPGVKDAEKMKKFIGQVKG